MTPRTNPRRSHAASFGVAYVVASLLLLALPMLRAEQPVRRVPKPGDEAIASASAKVQEVFADDLKAATTPQARRDLARRLLEFAGEAADAQTRFVLLDAAGRLAIEACDVPLAFDTFRRLAEVYDVDLVKLEIEALEKMATTGPSASLGPVIDAMVDKAREVAVRDAGAAERLAQLGAVAARKAKDRDRSTVATQALAEIREATKREQKTKPLVDRLRVSPSDADAAYQLGAIRCFDEQDWNQGLPLLARGSDPALARIARQDLATGNDATLHAAAGDAWWDYGRSHKEEAESAALERARFHYMAVAENVKGLERARIEKRLASLDDELKGAGAVSRKTGAGGLPGIVLWLDASDPKALGTNGHRPGTPVMTWRDVSGGGFDAAAHMPQAAPKVARFGASRLNALEFDGVQSGLMIRKRMPATSFKGLTAILVVDFSGPGTIKDRTYPVILANQQDANGGFSLHLRGEQTNKPLEFGTWPLVDPAGYAVLSDKAKTLTGPMIVVAVNSDKENLLYVSGQPPARQPNTGVVRARDFVTIGAAVDPVSGAPQRNFQGRIGEVILYSRALAEAEIAPLVRSLQSKWAVP